MLYRGVCIFVYTHMLICSSFLWSYNLGNLLRTVGKHKSNFQYTHLCKETVISENFLFLSSWLFLYRVPICFHHPIENYIMPMGFSPAHWVNKILVNICWIWMTRRYDAFNTMWRAYLGNLFPDYRHILDWILSLSQQPLLSRPVSFC